MYNYNLNEWATYINDYCERKGWNENLQIEKALMNCHSEITEAWEEIRNNHDITEVYYVDGKPEGVPIEIADTIIRLLHLAGYYKLDIDYLVRHKMDYNETRPYRHGNKAA